MPVDGGAGHAEEVGDLLLDCVITGVIELLCGGDLPGGEPRPAAPVRPRARAEATALKRLAVVRMALSPSRALSSFARFVLE
jgi:hypothetical protein